MEDASEAFIQRKYEPRQEPARSSAEQTRVMQAPRQRDIRELELALLREGVGRRDAGSRALPRLPPNAAGRGTRVRLQTRRGRSASCAARSSRTRPMQARLVHGPEFGHTMRLTDHRAALGPPAEPRGGLEH